MPENLKKISVIIPSFDGCRNGNVRNLEKQLVSQTLAPFEIIIVIGVSPNGRARNEGVKKASGDYYIFIDDDVALGDENVFQNLIKSFLEHRDIGMAGPSQLIPESSNQFQKKAANQIPRSLFPIQKELVDSDMVSHMCLAMPAKLFKDLGWENPDIISGTDPDLRYRVRKAGYRVCVAPNCWAYHPMPETFSKLIKLAFIKGRNSAIMRKTHPDLVFELDEGFKKNFAHRKPFIIRIVRTIFNILHALLLMKFIKLANAIAYILGNIWGAFSPIEKTKYE
jgi:GT2 family glycosyltransferase